MPPQAGAGVLAAFIKSATERNRVVCFFDMRSRTQPSAVARGWQTPQPRARPASGDYFLSRSGRFSNTAVRDLGAAERACRSEGAPASKHSNHGYQTAARPAGWAGAGCKYRGDGDPVSGLCFMAELEVKSIKSRVTAVGSPPSPSQQQQKQGSAIQLIKTEPGATRLFKYS